jgi:hypothetical protein
MITVGLSCSAAAVGALIEVTPRPAAWLTWVTEDAALLGLTPRVLEVRGGVGWACDLAWAWLS